jgi:hypothetical protein
MLMSNHSHKMEPLQIDFKEYEQLRPIAKIVLERKYSILLILEGLLFEYMYNEQEYEQKQELQQASEGING